MSSTRLSIALFTISFATVLFTLSVWKLLSFFIMPSLFFDLLFVGFPIGAFLGIKYFRVSRDSLLRTLWILQGVMVISVLACLTCKHFDYLRAHLFEVKLHKLIGQMAAFTGLFIPFFCAYGLSEYIGYQVGRSTLKSRMRLVYALYLFGAAFAYLFTELVLHQHLFLEALGNVGVSHMLVLSIALVALATALLAETTRQRLTFAVEAVLLVVLLVSPGLESGFLRLYKGESFQSTKSYLAATASPRGNPDSDTALPGDPKRFRLAFQRWGRYSLTEILESPGDRLFVGFYNDFMQWEYTRGTGFQHRMLGAVPINHIHAIKPGGRVAIIGSGGGRQVQWALQPWFRFERILALELEPAVFAAVRVDLQREFDSVYEAQNVTPHLGEARRYMEASDERFDLVFLPSVGGYPQMMLEPGNMIRTLDAYAVLRDRLTDNGILAIWYPKGLDPELILTEQYVRTLGKQGLGLTTRAYISEGPAASEFLILASKSQETRLPSVKEIDSFFLGTESEDPYPLPPVQGTLTRELFVTDDPDFKPITDEQPFLAGNVRHIFSLANVYTLFAIAAGFLVLVGILLMLALRRNGDPGIPGRSYWQVVALSFLIGANFIIFEHYVILALFKQLYVYHHALVVGAISFLVLSGLGSVIVTNHIRTLLLGVASLLLAVLLICQLAGVELPFSALLAGIAPVAFVTGSLFPALFDLAAKNPIAVFAMDAVGAATGSTLSFFLPIAFGFSVFFPFAVAVFVVTAFCTWRFYRGQLDDQPQRV